MHQPTYSSEAYFKSGTVLYHHRYYGTPGTIYPVNGQCAVSGARWRLIKPRITAKSFQITSQFNQAYRSGQGSYIVVEEPESPGSELLPKWDGRGRHFGHWRPVIVSHSTGAVAFHYVRGRGLSIHDYSAV